MTTDFGTDIGTDADGDLDLSFALVTGRPCLARDLVRRYQTPRGSLFWDRTVGEDLEAQIHKGHNATSLSELRARLATEAEGDERVLSASATAAFNALDVLIATVVVVPKDSPEEPFRLVLAIDAVTVTVLESP